MSAQQLLFQGIYNAIEEADEEAGAENLSDLLAQFPGIVDVQSQVDAPWGSQYNALTWAIDRQKVRSMLAIVDYLRERGRGIRSGDIRQRNPIQLAITNRTIKPFAGKPGGQVVFETLLIKSTLQELSASVGEGRNRETAWHYAASENVLSVFKTFAEDLNTTLPGCKNSQGQTAFHVAAEKDRLDIVKYLSEVAKSVVLLQDNNQETALHLAVRKGNYEIAKFIVKNHPLSVSICNRFKKSPYLTRGPLSQAREKTMGPVFDIIKEAILRLEEYRDETENTTTEEIRRLLYGDSPIGR